MVKLSNVALLAFGLAVMPLTGCDQTPDEPEQVDQELLELQKENQELIQEIAELGLSVAEKLAATDMEEQVEPSPFIKNYVCAYNIAEKVRDYGERIKAAMPHVDFFGNIDDLYAQNYSNADIVAGMSLNSSLGVLREYIDEAEDRIELIQSSFPSERLDGYRNTARGLVKDSILVLRAINEAKDAFKISSPVNEWDSLSDQLRITGFRTEENKTMSSCPKP